jgi:putative nucleotidyltransferase with HDIG domain
MFKYLKIQQSESNLSSLLDPQSHLLALFKDTCPGSFKHSQALVAMVESVGSNLGLNVPFMKVCALYHDVSKLYNPKFFSENQSEGENIHDNLAPEISYQIITRHVSDGALILLNNRNFSRDVIDVVTQHHGSTVVKYFFDKSQTTDEISFRYKASKPQSLEAAILMMCDVTEAKSRSISQSHPESLDPSLIINSTIDHLLNDGQFDDVYLRLGDLKVIKEILIKELDCIYQKRVDYDKVVGHK